MIPFPPWTARLGPLLPAIATGALVYLVGLFWYGASPQALDVGYAPKQPVPYSHALHAGELGIDCRYCHNTVDVAARAAIPSAETCMNCHKRIKATSDKLALIRESYETGRAVQWTRVHDLPDYVYFNHSAHVTRGVGCVSCHGRVDTMDVVRQVQPLSMGWCLECHRNPEPNLRPLDQVTSMTWAPHGDAKELGERLAQDNHVNPPTDCSTCHR